MLLCLAIPGHNREAAMTVTENRSYAPPSGRRAGTTSVTKAADVLNRLSCAKGHCWNDELGVPMIELTELSARERLCVMCGMQQVQFDDFPDYDSPTWYPMRCSDDISVALKIEQAVFAQEPS